VRAAEVSVGRGRTTLQRFGQVALPPGAVRDGEVADPPSVSEALRQLWSSARFSTKKVVLGVANQKVVVRQVDLPWMPVEELRKSLAFQVQDFIPMPVEQAILDFHPVEEFVTGEGTRTLRVLLVAAARDMVSSLLAAVKGAGLEATQIDLAPFALVRSVVPAVSVLPGEADAIVDIGARVTNIVVQQGGVPRFVRILLMGGENITDAVGERMGVPFEQAEAIKQQLGMSPVAGQLDMEHPAARVVETTASAFVDEVRGSLDYYLAQPGSARLSGVRVSGGGSRLLNLPARLSQATRLPVTAVEPLGRFENEKTGLTPEQLSYVEPATSVSLGLALGVA
jgi:type IV pilus assembly protein PilM